jgi:RND superfamily putative drug exporter
VLFSGVIGSLVFSRLDSGGYSNPASESYEVYEYLKNDLKIEDPAIVVVVDSKDVEVTDPTVVQKAAALEAKIAQEPGVTKTLSYWSSGGLESLNLVIVGLPTF